MSTLSSLLEGFSPLEKYADPFESRLRAAYGGNESDYGQQYSGVFATARSDPRVILDASGLRSTDAAGNVLVYLAVGAAPSFTISSASSGQRIVLGLSGLFLYNSAGNEIVGIRSSGSPLFRVRSAVSGARFEITESAACVVYDSSGSQAVNFDADGLKFYVTTTEQIFDGLRWWRQGTADTTYFAGVFGKRTTTGVAVQIAVNDISGLTTSNIQLAYTKASAASPNAVVQLSDFTIDLRTANADTSLASRIQLLSTSIILDADDGGSVGRVTLFKGRQTDGEQVRIEGMLRIADVGMHYDNAFRLSSTSVGANNKVLSSVTYATAFPSGTTVPDCFVAIKDPNHHLVSCYFSSPSLTGVTVARVNIDTGASHSMEIAGLPVAPG
jgi:hypothetical protein